jgi:DNA-binding MarR family transcriptional regulator
MADPGAAEQTSDELLEELASFGPRQLIGALRGWHKGSLSVVHLNVLALLESVGPIPMTQLAEELDVSVASATGIVGRMEKRGLVERRHGEEDRRLVLVHLTETGTGIFRSIDERRRGHLVRLVELLSDEERAGLLVGLRAMREVRAGQRGERPRHPTADCDPGEAAE